MTASRKAKNEFDRIKGRAKEEIGEATGNARLPRRGPDRPDARQGPQDGRTRDGRASRPPVLARRSGLVL